MVCAEAPAANAARAITPAPVNARMLEVIMSDLLFGSLDSPGRPCGGMTTMRESGWDHLTGRGVFLWHSWGPAMSSPNRGQVTRILADLGKGDPHAAQKLLPLVYEELRRLAHDRMRHEPPGHTLDPTALVHEAYVRLVGSEDPAATWDSRGHFFAAAAEAMRRILIERARRQRMQKHGGGRGRVSLDEARVAASEDTASDVLALDEALKKLEAEDRVRSDVVKLRYFAGLTIEQTADVLGISHATVSRHWTYARTWLYQEMMRAGDRNPESGEVDGGTFSH
jgi:RNA polymerase sigma factor (TIGR02999 family)